jgi:hypothetical protein
VKPRAAFDRLFASALSADDADAVARAFAPRSAPSWIWVNRDLNRLRTRVGAERMRKMEAQVEALRSIGRLMGLDIDSFGNIDPDSGPLAGIAG